MENTVEVDPEYSPFTDEPDYWADTYGDIADFSAAMSVAEPTLVQMGRDLDGGQGWATLTDITRVWDICSDGFNEWFASKSDGSDQSQLTITFPNKRLAVLWHAEVVGQISDGAWENVLRRDSQTSLCHADTRVDEQATETTVDGGWYPKLFYTDKLTEFDGQEERMIFYVRASGLDPEYGYSDLKEDLQTLQTMTEYTPTNTGV